MGKMFQSTNQLFIIATQHTHTHSESMGTGSGTWAPHHLLENQRSPGEVWSTRKKTQPKEGTKMKGSTIKTMKTMVCRVWFIRAGSWKDNLFHASKLFACGFAWNFRDVLEVQKGYSDVTPLHVTSNLNANAQQRCGLEDDFSNGVCHVRVPSSKSVWSLSACACSNSSGWFWFWLYGC